MTLPSTMPSTLPSTSLSTSVSIHLGSSSLWAVGDGREFCCSADVDSENAVVAGVDAIDAVAAIDDEYLDIDGRITPTVLELARRMARGVEACGVSEPDLLYVSCPSNWGNPRKTRLTDAARRVAHDVVLVPTCIAAARSVRSAWRARCIVVELRGGGMVVSVVTDIDGELRIDGTDSGEISDLAAVFADIGECSVRDTVVVVGPRSQELVVSLERGGANIHGHADIRTLDESRLAWALVDPRVVAHRPLQTDGPEHTSERSTFGAGWVLPSGASQPVSRSGVLSRSGALPSMLHGDGARRWSRSPLTALVAAGIAVIVVSAVIVFAGRDSADDPASEALSPSGGVSLGEMPDGAVPETDDNPHPVRRAVGSVNAELPADWSVVTIDAAPGRTDAIPPAGADRKIVIVEKQLTAGAVFEAVAADLRRQFSTFEDPLRFGEFAVAEDSNNRQVITYVEFPDDYSEVRWQVYVLGGRQVSVGCQYLLDEWDSLAPDCARVWQTLEAGP